VFVKEKSLKQKNDSNRGGGEYQKFDEFSSHMRDPVIKSYVEKVIAHAAANGGIYHQGFVKDQVDKAAVVQTTLTMKRRRRWRRRRGIALFLRRWASLD
jgi:hypothetical protein